MHDESFESHRAVMGLVRRDIRFREPLVPAHSRRGRIVALLLLVFMAMLGSYLFFQTDLLFGRFQERLRVDRGDSAKIRIYNQQLESLQGKMAGFIAGSVETKLRTLEKSVAAGTVGAQEIKTFEELKSELKLLESYSMSAGGNTMDQARLEHERFQVLPGSQQAAADGDLMQEILHLQNLFYLGIASCGMIGVLIGGYWWQQESRYKRLHTKLSRTLLLANKTVDQ